MYVYRINFYFIDVYNSIKWRRMKIDSVEEIWKKLVIICMIVSSYFLDLRFFKLQVKFKFKFKFEFKSNFPTMNLNSSVLLYHKLYFS